jgi:hypothetical protein
VEALWTWFNNGLVQSDIISPLIGAVLGVLFAGFSSAPQGQSNALSVQTTTNIYTTVYIDRGSKSSGSTDDGWSYLVAFGIVVVVTTWGYSYYSTAILDLWSELLFTCFSFVFATAVISSLKGQFSSLDWVGYVGAPLAALLLCLYFISLAQQGVIAGASEAAHAYFQAYGITGIWDFYKALSKSQIDWTILQLAGVLAGVLCTLAATLRALHYLALMNQRGDSFLDSFWRWVVRITLPISKRRSMVGLIVIAIVSWLSLKGFLFQFVSRWN